MGVAIRKSGDGWHTGILHKKEDSRAELLHLAFHHRLRNEAPDAEYSWVQPRPPAPRARAPWPRSAARVVPLGRRA